MIKSMFGHIYLIIIILVNDCESIKLSNSHSEESDPKSPGKGNNVFNQNYIISIENHNINDKINIQNTFAHNYEYIYKLWSCQPANRELLKITLFEKVVDGKNSEIVKRGEASQLVKYSH